MDRHVGAGRGQDVAVIWDSPVSGRKEKWTYQRVLEEVEVLAGVLRQQRVGRGDVVLIYSMPISMGGGTYSYRSRSWQKSAIWRLMFASQYLVPMIPAALFGMLASARLGAIHAVVFGGFAAASLAQRIEASKPKVVLTASCGIEGAKGPLGYKSFIRGALQKSRFSPNKVMIWDREEHPWDGIEEAKGEVHWQDLIAKAKQKGIKAECVPIKSGEGLYIIYTSGQCNLQTIFQNQIFPLHVRLVKK